MTWRQITGLGLRVSGDGGQLAGSRLGAALPKGGFQAAPRSCLCLGPAFSHGNHLTHGKLSRPGFQ